MTASVMISIRISPADLDAIDRNAAAAGLNRTEYLIELGTSAGAGDAVRAVRALERAQRAAVELAERIDADLVAVESAIGESSNASRSEGRALPRAKKRVTARKA